MNRPPHSFRPSFPSHEVRRMSLLPSPRPPPPNDWKGGYHEREPYERHGPRGWNEEGRDYQGDEYFDYKAWPQIQNRPPSCIPPTNDLPYERIRISPTRREGPRPLMAGISHSVQPVREYRIRQHDSDYDYGFDNDPREVAGSSLPPWRMPPCVDWHNEPSRAEDWDEQGGWPYDGPRRIRGRPVPLMDETPSSRPGSLPREWASERLHPGNRAAHPRLLHEESMPGVHPLIDNPPYDKPSVQGDGPPAGGMHVSVHEYWHGGRTDTEGVPSPAQKNDFLGRRPPKFPHTCTLCVRPISGVKDWNAHLKGKVHQTLCQELLARYPNWKPEKWMTNENRAKAEKTPRSKPVGTDKVQVEEMDLDDSGDEASNKNADNNSASNARSVEADTAGNGVGRSTTNSAANSSDKGGESELEKYKMLLSKEREVNKLLQQRLHQYYEEKQSSQGENPSFDNYPAKKELPTDKEQFQLQSARQTRIPFGFR